jgi:hypothetical protein
VKLPLGFKRLNLDTISTVPLPYFSITTNTRQCVYSYNKPICPSRSKPHLEICVSSFFSPFPLFLLCTTFGYAFRILQSLFLLSSLLYTLLLFPHSLLSSLYPPPFSKCTFPWLIARQSIKSRKTLVYVKLKDKICTLFNPVKTKRVSFI